MSTDPSQVTADVLAGDDISLLVIRLKTWPLGEIGKQAAQVIERLERERDQAIGQAKVNAQTVIRQANEMRKMERDFRAELRDAVAEDRWKTSQGEDYGSY